MCPLGSCYISLCIPALVATIEIQCSSLLSPADMPERILGLNIRRIQEETLDTNWDHQMSYMTGRNIHLVEVILMLGCGSACLQQTIVFRLGKAKVSQFITIYRGGWGGGEVFHYLRGESVG